MYAQYEPTIEELRRKIEVAMKDRVHSTFCLLRSEWLVHAIKCIIVHAV